MWLICVLWHFFYTINLLQIFVIATGYAACCLIYLLFIVNEFYLEMNFRLKWWNNKDEQLICMKYLSKIECVWCLQKNIEITKSEFKWKVSIIIIIKHHHLLEFIQTNCTKQKKKNRRNNIHSTQQQINNIFRFFQMSERICWTKRI